MSFYRDVEAVLSQFLPRFIFEAITEDVKDGSLNCVCLSIDLAGFTEMSEQLMTGGKSGAEDISDILQQSFEPIIEVVSENGGSVASFGGDSLTIIFPESESCFVASIRTAFAARDIYNNVFVKNKFARGLRIGLSFGEVAWGVIETDDLNTIYVRGSAIEKAIECQLASSDQQILCDEKLTEKIASFTGTTKKHGRHIIQSFDSNLFIDIPVRKKLDYRLQRDFVPSQFLESRHIASLRSVTTVFLGFDINLGRDDLSNLVVLISNLLAEKGGYLNKLEFGDKGGVALVIFGAPVSYDDNVDKALAFVRELQKNTELKITAGISYGPVYAGFIGHKLRQEYTVLGKAVNLASRLMEFAPSGEIAVDHGVIKGSSNKIEYRKLSQVKIRGANSHKDVFLLKGLRTHESKESSKRPFVGRLQEVRAITANLNQFLDKSQFKPITIVSGELGIGKSRLLEEAFQRKFYQQNSFEVCRLKKSSQHFSSLSYFYDYFTSFFQMDMLPSSQNRVDVFRERYVSFVDSLSAEFINRENLYRIESLIGSILDLFWKDSVYDLLRQSDREEQVLEAVYIWFDQMCDLGPIVFQLEDTNLLNAQDIHFINNFLPKLLKKGQVSLVATRRQMHQNINPLELLELEFETNYIQLSYLEEVEAKEHLELCLGMNIDQQFVSEVLKAIPGNPLLLEQLAIHIRENQLYSNTISDSERKINLDKIPSSISELIISKFDTMNSYLSDLVKIASANGLVSSMELLYFCYLNLLEDLSFPKERFLSLVIEGEKLGVWSYDSMNQEISFHHQLFVEVIYDHLISKDRTAFHGAYADSLVYLSKGDPGTKGAIAYHYQKSNQNAEAILYYQQAIEFEEEVTFHLERAKLYSQSIVDILGKDARSETYFWELVRLGRLEREILQYSASETHLIKAIQLSERGYIGANDLSHAHYELAYLYFMIESFDKSKIHLDKIDRIANTEGADVGVLARSYYLRSQVFLAGGLPGYSLASLHQAEKILNKDHEFINQVYLSLSKLYLAQGERKTSEYYYYQWERACQNSNSSNLQEQIESLEVRGKQFAYKGLLVKAISEYKKALAIVFKLFGSSHPKYNNLCREISFAYHYNGYLSKALTYKIENVRNESNISNNFSLGRLLWKKGKVSSALKYLQKSVELCEGKKDRGTRDLHTWVISEIIRIKTMQGKVAECERLIKIGEELESDHQEFWARKVELLILKGDLKQALSLLIEIKSNEDVSRNFDPDDQRQYYHSYAKVLYGLGRFHEALAAAKNAIFEMKLGMPRDPGQFETYLLMARICLSINRLDLSQFYFEQCRSFYAREFRRSNIHLIDYLSVEAEITFHKSPVEALDLFKNVLSLMESYLVPGHPLLVEIYSKMAELLLILEQPMEASHYLDMIHELCDRDLNRHDMAYEAKDRIVSIFKESGYSTSEAS